MRMRGKSSPRSQIAGEAMVPAMPGEDRPEGLPEGWTVERRRRGGSSRSKNKVDRYYVCPASGKQFRSMPEVMQYLNQEVADRSESSSLVVADEAPEGSLVESRKRKRNFGDKMLKASEGVTPEKMIIPAVHMKDRPRWLPENWLVEYRKRGRSCLDSSRIDRYYICPYSGQKLRSRLEVMRFLNAKEHDRMASSSIVVHNYNRRHNYNRGRSAVVKRKRPEWLPEDWLVEFRKRKLSNIIDKYYICPLSGVKFRSRVAVMRFLDSNLLDSSGEGYKQLNYIDPITGNGFRSKRDVLRYYESSYYESRHVPQIAFKQKRTHTPDAYTLEEEFLPIQLYKKSRVKRTVTKRRLFSKEEAMSTMSSDIKSMKSLAKSTSSPGCSFPSLDSSAPEICCPIPLNGELMEQSILQIQWRSDPAFQEEGSQLQPPTLNLPDSRNIAIKTQPVIASNLSEIRPVEVTMNQNQNQLKGQSVAAGLKKQPSPAIPNKNKRPVQDTDIAEEAQFEMNQKLSELKRHAKTKKHGTGEEFQRKPAGNCIQESGNKMPQEPLGQLASERVEVLNLNFSKGKQLGRPHERIQLKGHGIKEHTDGEAGTKVPTGPSNDKPSEPGVQLEGETVQDTECNLSENLNSGCDENHSQHRMNGSSEEYLEKIPEPLMQLEGDRCPVSDRQSEEMQFELTEKLSLLKGHRKPKTNGTNELIQGYSTVEVVQEPASRYLSESLMQLESERQPVTNDKMIEEKRNQTEIQDIGKECQIQEESKTMEEPASEKPLESLTQIEGEIPLVAKDNMINEKQSRPKRRRNEKGHQQRSGRKALQEPRSEKQSESLMQIERVTLPVPDANSGEEVQFAMNQKLSQIKRRGQAKRRKEAKTTDEKLTEPCLQLESKTLQVRNDNVTEEKQTELTEKPSQLKKRSRGYSRGSGSTGSSKSKRKAENASTEPVRVSKRLAGVKANPIPKRGNSKQPRRAKPKQIELPPLSFLPEIPVVGSGQESIASLARKLYEKLKKIQASTKGSSSEKQDVQTQPTMPVDSDQGCSSEQTGTALPIDVLERFEKLKPFVEQTSTQGQAETTVPADSDSPETDQLQEKLSRLKPFEEQTPEEQPVIPLAATPVGVPWLDPCIEFAFKTLTSDIPVSENVAAIEDFFSSQIVSCKKPDVGAGSGPLPSAGPSSGK